MAGSTKIKIRPLRHSDIEAIMLLHRELGWNPAFQADGSTLRQRLQALITEENALLLVAEISGRMVGYIHGETMTYLLFAGREMVISEVFVVQKARGQGVGKAILDHLLALAADRGVHRVSLETGGMETFIPARSFYAAAGFEVCGPFGNYRSGTTSVFMTLASSSGSLACQSFCGASRTRAPLAPPRMSE